MVNDNLHIICGNCGANDMWERADIDMYGQDFDDRFEPDVSIACGNCATLHSLSKYIPVIKREDSFSESDIKELQNSEEKKVRE